MRILIIGIISFFIWSLFSTYIYVCKVKGICDKPVAIQVDEVKNYDTPITDTIQKSQEVEEVLVPKDIVIYFAFDKSDFKADAQTDNYILEAKAYLDRNSEAKLSITGHTDAIGTNEYNQALGVRRAQSVQHYCESMGIQAKNSIIESKGESEPADDNNTKAGRAKNRRTVITLKK